MSDEYELIDVTPDQSLMPKLGKSGYSIPQAIAELVDNAIDARLDERVLHVAVKIGKNEISVADDGRGMDRAEMQDAMVLARSEKQNMLGEFGLGLKTSCTNLGRDFRVVTSKCGVPFEYEVEYNEAQWLSAGHKWKIPLRQRPQDANKHFTIVVITGLNKYYSGVVDVVVRDLQQRFAPFINDGSLELKINKKLCKPESFDLLDETRKDFSIQDKFGNRIWGWYGLLKQGSNKGLYGFHTYRLGRMITTYDKIAIGEHPTISRVIGELHLDVVPVTHNKREFDRDSAEYWAAVEALKVELQDILRLARQRASSDSLTKAVKNEMERWKDSLARALQSSDLRAFTAPVHTPSDEADDSGTAEAEVDVERRERPESDEAGSQSNEELNSERPESLRERVPKATQKKPRHIVKVKGKTIDFRHEFRSLGEKESWYEWVFDESVGLDVYTNTDFPAYFTTRDKAFYAVVHIAESVANLLVREAGATAGELEDVKQLILRKSAAVKDQWTEDEEVA